MRQARTGAAHSTASPDIEANAASFAATFGLATASHCQPSFSCS
jgi:hypothetical protein